MNLAYVCVDRGIALGGVKGASAHLRSLAAALVRSGHRVTVLCAKLDGPNPLPSGAECKRVDPETPVEEFVELLQSVGAQAVLERHSLGGGAALDAAVRLGLGAALEVNAPLVDEAARFRGLQDVETWRAWERDRLARAPAVIAVSTALRAHALACGAPEHRVTVVPNGVDLTAFGTADGHAIRRRLGLEDAFVVGFAGSLKPWHGVRHLVDALPSLSARTRLLVVGDGPERQGLEDSTRELGNGSRVVFTGALPQAEVPSHLHAMDVAVAPFEAVPEFYFSPLKIAEYLAAGRAVVASRLGDIPELLGDAGLLWEPGDGAGLVRLLRTLESDDAARRSLEAKAVRRAGALSWDAAAAKVVAALRSTQGAAA